MPRNRFPRTFQPFRPVLFYLLLGLTAGAPAAWAQGFDPAATYPTVAGTRPYGLAVGDINGDGLLDIVAGDNDGTVHTTSILMGQPGGLFGTAIALPSVAGSWDLALGDVNRDGRLDLVTAAASPPVSVGVQLGQAGGFGTMRTYQTGGVITQNLALGDLNGDGLPDIVEANIGTNNVSVLLGTPSGFASASSYSAGLNSEPFAVAIGDMNGDGRPDIVTGNMKTATIGILLGQPGGFAPAVTYPAFRSRVNSTSQYLLGIALTDVDGDGALDVVATSDDSLTGPTLGVLLGQAGSLGAVAYYGSVGLPAHSLAVGDVNGDGWPDIVLASSVASAVGVLLGFPGGFSAPISYSTGAGSVPWAVKLLDANNDGRLDIVTTNSATSSVGVLLNSLPQLLTATNTVPGSGSGGTTITLNGSNLRGAVAVVFAGSGNRTASSGFAVNAAGTQITGIVVPSGAASGPLRVVTPGGTVTSNTAFTVLSPTATQAGQAAGAMAVYPNPAQTSARLTLPATPLSRPVLVLDALGRVVRQATLPALTDNLTLDLTGLPAGLYGVRCGAATSRLAKE